MILISYLILLLYMRIEAAPTSTTQSSNTESSNGYAPQISPIFPGVRPPSGAATSYNYGPYSTETTLPRYTLSGYPPTWAIPDANHPEVIAVIQSINWQIVPNAPIRLKDGDGRFVFNTDGPEDPFCWWSDTNCVTPKVSYLPPDYYKCPKKRDWGLSFDDGPFNPSSGSSSSSENKYAEPALFNYLLKQNNQKASFFFIGSNVVSYPAAAKRALNDGHNICIHTYSHPVMTTLTNNQVVAEFYWSLKAVKEATGVTPKCWRPPQGDVDDRIRAIAWQMGMHTILWNEDTDDWALPAPGGGTLAPEKVDESIQTWISQAKTGSREDGIVVLQHELNSATISLTMHWLPTLQTVFNVVPALACNGITQPYWESDFVYPLTFDPPPTSDNSNYETDNTNVDNGVHNSNYEESSTSYSQTGQLNNEGTSNTEGYRNDIVQKEEYGVYSSNENYNSEFTHEYLF
ncbi:carbohydrate esterase family 4 protein [Backusella circina FSU 941]|nr:carbohydrate esterase family 4 protein [Backusella circina FSU 941]